MLRQRINMVAPNGQVYAWVRKYKDKGIEGLYDRRGKNKAISQLSDIEKLKAENRLLKAQTQQQQMEIDFLKKARRNRRGGEPDQDTKI